MHKLKSLFWIIFWPYYISLIFTNRQINMTEKFSLKLSLQQIISVASAR